MELQSSSIDEEEGQVDTPLLPDKSKSHSFCSRWKWEIMISLYVVLTAISIGLYFSLRSNNDYSSTQLDASITLIRGGAVFAPQALGQLDILVMGTRIEALMPNGSEKVIAAFRSAGKYATIIDASDQYVTPGIVDVHIHAGGAGGEKGPPSRTPEAKLSQLIEAGVTTAVGLLGTDGVTRDLRTVLQKMKGLEEDGLTTFMWSGAYRVPSPTLTGSLMSDMLLIDKILGVGELAISDHRGSWPDTNEIARIANEVYVGGMLAGKAGKVYIHMGANPTGLDPIWDVVNQTNIPITAFYPTHMSRNNITLAAAVQWIAAGGYVDLTADSGNGTNTLNALIDWKEQGVPLDHVSVSSDAYGSLPKFDANGNVIAYDVGNPNTDLILLRNLVLNNNWSLSTALPLLTMNPASFLSLSNKGQLTPSADADILVLSKNLELNYVMAKGQIIKTPTWTKHGMFDP